MSDLETIEYILKTVLVTNIIHTIPISVLKALHYAVYTFKVDLKGFKQFHLSDATLHIIISNIKDVEYSTLNKIIDCWCHVYQGRTYELIINRGLMNVIHFGDSLTLDIYTQMMESSNE